MSTKQESTKNILTHKKIFLIGLSFKWSSLERLVISDAQAIIKNGGEVFLYTFRDSVLDQKAKEIGAQCFYHQGIVATKLIKWNRLKSVSKLIKKHQADLVHCYDIKMLWPLSYFLKTKPLIPLVLTVHDELKHFYRGFWYRPLNRRIDQIFTTSPVINENVWGNLGVPPIKVKPLGLPMAKVDKGSGSTSLPFQTHEDRWYLGTNLSGIEKNTHFLDNLFHVLKVLLGQDIAGKKITFVLASERRWNECLITDELRRRVKDWGLEDYVAFMGPCLIPELQPHLDLWIGMKTRESLEDYCVNALYNGVPTLLPRTTMSMELLRNGGKIGETYKIGDARSLREKCMKVLQEVGEYRRRLEKFQGQLDELHNSDRYQKRLAESYQQLMKRRLRLMRSVRKRFT